MLASLAGAALNVAKLDLGARLRAMKVTAMLTLFGAVLLLTATGFGLALLYVWLQQMQGTLVALAIIAGACVLLALILLMLAAWRPGRRVGTAHRASSPPPGANAGAATERMIEEAITAMQQGSREQVVTTLSLALAIGIILGRRM